MSRLSDRWVIQQIGGNVIIFEEGTEREIVRYRVSDVNAMSQAQKTIHENPELTDEEKCFAHFWCGYFYAHSGGINP